jgi:hypothetical protein
MHPQIATPASHVRRIPASTLAVAGIIAAAVFIALLIGMAHTRRPWNDEAMFANPALNLAEKGFMGITVYEGAGVLPELNRYTYLIFPLNLVTLAGWYKVIGFSLMSTRVLSMLWTFALLGEIYYLIRTWSASVSIALLAVLLTAFDYNILVAGSFGRYEPMVAALGFGGYCCYLALREQHPRWAIFTSNTCIALAGMTHPNGLMFFCGLVFLVLYYDRKSLRVAWLAIAAIPYVAGAIVWGQYLLRSPQAAYQQLHVHSSGRIVLLHPVEAVVGEVQRYMQAAGFTAHLAGHSGPVFLKSVPLVFYLIAVAAMIAIPELRRHRGYRVLLFLTAVHFGYQCFLEGTKFPFYLVHLMPLYAAMLAIVAVYLWQRRRAPRLLIAAALGLVMAISAGGVLLRIRLDTYHRLYMPAVNYIQQHAGPSDLVMASCDFGFAYGFRPNLMDDIRIGYFTGKIPKFIVVEEIYQANFDAWKAGSPDLYRFIARRLSEYDLVYDYNSYRIYRRKDSLL